MQVWLFAPVSFQATPAETLILFMDYSLSCLSDEVMWMRIYRMGFSVEKEKNHPLDSPWRWHPNWAKHNEGAEATLNR